MLSQLKSFYYFYETEIINISTVSGDDTKNNDTISEID